MNDQLDQEKPAAVAALNALRQFAPGTETGLAADKPHETTNQEYLLTLHFLTEEQLHGLSNHQLSKLRIALENFEVECDANRREGKSSQAETALCNSIRLAEDSGDTSDQCKNENRALGGDEKKPTKARALPRLVSLLANPQARRIYVSPSCRLAGFRISSQPILRTPLHLGVS
jgi:hypothetical protein